MKVVKAKMQKMQNSVLTSFLSQYDTNPMDLPTEMQLQAALINSLAAESENGLSLTHLGSNGWTQGSQRLKMARANSEQMLNC